MASTFPVVLLLALALCTGVCAHFNLRTPLPYNRIDCNPPECPGACPPKWKTGPSKARNDVNSPSAVWKRGSFVNIQWHRNNHVGGYFRRSLVPVKHMYDFSWHKKTAFEYGCFSQGLYKCGFGEKCGTDTKGLGYQSMMRVPEVFPDGDYVFAMVWYGGLRYDRSRARFSDYKACAHVRIRGGNLINSYSPTFWAGSPSNKLDFQEPGQCLSSSDHIGECKGDPCHHKPVKSDVAFEFRNGRSPAKVYNWFFNNI